MSKARDLANAGTALGAVSATELAYVDGVTSAIQTQIDGKQAINANVSTTELGYLDGVTSAIQTQIDSKIGSASAINPTIVDAKGDIITATAADTPARLAVGANGTVLTAASGQATGLEWATPAGALTLTSIASGTLSGGSVVTSGLTQDFIQVTMHGITLSTAANIYIRLNGASSNYHHNYWMLTSYPDYQWTSQLSGTGASQVECTGQTLKSTVGANSFVFTFQNCKQAGITTYSGNSVFERSTQSSTVGQTLAGYYNSAAAITSITIGTTSGTFSGGTYKIVGG